MLLDKPAADSGQVKQRSAGASKSFARSSLQTFVVRLSVMVANAVGGIIVARWLGPEKLGIYFLIVLLPQLAFRLGNLGFSSAITFFAAQGKASTRKLFGLALIIAPTMAVVSGLILLGVRTQSFSPWRDIDARLFYLFLGTVPLEFSIFYFQRLLGGKLRITKVNISSVINGYGMLALQILFVVILDWGLWGALIGVASAMLLVCVYLLWQAQAMVSELHETDKSGNSKALVGELWRFGRWDYLIMLTDYFHTQLPLFVLKRFFLNDIIGFFSVARGLEAKTRELPTPFSAMLFPFTAASNERDAVRRTNMLCRIFLVVMLVITGVLVLAVKPLVVLLYGEIYLPVASVFYALAPSVVLWPLGLFLMVHIRASGKPKIVFLVNLGTLATAVVICWLLIPKYGAVGSGVSVSIIYGTRVFFQLLTYMKVTGASFSEVFLPRRADWDYSIRTVKDTVAKLSKKAKVNSQTAQ
jgi:O-antigen/teichoic acid export membrane protein